MRFYVHHRKFNRGGVKTLVTIIVHPHEQSDDGSEWVLPAAMVRNDLAGGTVKAGTACVSNGSGNK
jgi:hypothetical protein